MTMMLKTLNVNKFDVELKVNEAVESQEMDIDLLGKSYIIGLVNMTASTCATIAATRRVGGSDAEWKWTVIPKVCPNCREDFQTCCNKGRYSPIMSTECDDSAFELFVGYMLDSDTAKGTIIKIIPNCQYAGGLVGLED